METTATTHILDVQHRARQIRNVLIAIMALNLSVAVAKFGYGMLSHSAAMQAAGIDSFFDGAGNVVGLIGISLANRPADLDHPYGHGKFETMASSIIGALLFVAALRIGYDAIMTMISGEHGIYVTPISFVVMLATLAVNLGITLYERRVGRRLGSEILIADSMHTLSDSLVSFGVILGLALAAFGLVFADSIVALIISLVILYTSFMVFKQITETLSDKIRLPLEDIQRIAMAHPEIKDCHRIRTRGTPSEVFADCHVLVDPLMTVRDSHAIADALEQELRVAFPCIADVTIHVEPDDEKERQNP